MYIDLENDANGHISCIQYANCSFEQIAGKDDIKVLRTLGVIKFGGTVLIYSILRV